MIETRERVRTVHPETRVPNGYQGQELDELNAKALEVGRLAAEKGLWPNFVLVENAERWSLIRGRMRNLRQVVNGLPVLTHMVYDLGANPPVLSESVVLSPEEGSLVVTRHSPVPGYRGGKDNYHTPADRSAAMLRMHLGNIVGNVEELAEKHFSNLPPKKIDQGLDEIAAIHGLPAQA